MHLDKEMEYKDEYIKALLVEKLAGTISEEEASIVDSALASSPEAMDYWQSLCLKFDSSSRASDFLDSLDEHRAWNHVEQQLDEVQTLEDRVRPKKNAVWYAVSAVAVLVLAFASFWLLRSPIPADQPAITHQVHLKTDGGQTLDLSSDRKFKIAGTELNNQSRELSYATEAGKPLQWATLVVPPTKDYKIKLDDGTVVWLNAASSLRFPFRFNDDKREVYLTGEAYFEVAKNNKIPFIVHTNFAAVHVHGTSFNVNAYENEGFTASLVEGSVSAVKNGKNIRLSPGEEVFERSGNLGVRNFDSDLLSWRSGTYYFHRRSLAEIAQVLVRWYDVKIAWKSESISTQVFTGEIDKRQALEVVLSNLQLTSGINSRMEKGVLTFY